MQLPVIEEAKRRGFKVLVTDQNLHCAAANLADRIIPLSTYDIESHRLLARNLALVPKAVLSPGADVGPTVSAVAEELNLPAASFECAVRTRNKAQMRVALGEGGSSQSASEIGQPVYMEASPGMPSEAWEALAYGKEIAPYPCVVKALDNAGSRGMSLVRTSGELGPAIELAAKSGKNVTGKALIEEYVFGPEFALDFFVVEGLVYLANACERRFHKFGIEAGHINPWTPPAEVIQMCQLAATRLGVTFGPFKVDIVKTSRYGWCVLECATRLSGGFDHMYTAPLATGRDITGAMLDIALGLPLAFDKLMVCKQRYAVAYAPLYRPGPIRGWDGLEEILSFSDVKHVFVREMREIKPLQDCAARPVFVIMTGDDPRELWWTARSFATLIQPIYDNTERVWERGRTAKSINHRCVR